MRDTLLEALRCPFCGSPLTVIDNAALVRTNGQLDAGVLGCDCCAFPVVGGIPVLIANDVTRDAMHRLESGRPEDALLTMLGLDDAGAAAFHALFRRSRPTYKDALSILSHDAEADYFLYRFSDPPYLTIEALLQAVGQNAGARSGRVLDLCGGSGHLTRVLTRIGPAGGVVDADVYFWKLWLAKRFLAPDCDAVCCDANDPLPFAPDTFSMAMLADAFPYIWHKRLLADEMMRLVGPDGTIVMPHLHSSLGENFSAGMTLTPSAYRDLFARQGARLFSDERLYRDMLERRTIDLTDDAEPDAIGSEPSVTIVASRRPEVFRKYDVTDWRGVNGELAVNPLYKVERSNDSSTLTLTFPTPEYEEEFGACKEYLPARLTIRADLTAPIQADALGADYEELRQRRVIIDAPLCYC
jgi:uncharacterized protein YbaR (Trm112 family)/SAM-dependent methyltransferase